MKKILLGIFLLLAAHLSAATIKGSVIDAKGDAMPFVTISVLAQDSSLLTGAITDDDGKYAVEVNVPNYIIQASYVGYHTAYGGPDFVLREETEQLKELLTWQAYVYLAAMVVLCVISIILQYKFNKDDGFTWNMREVRWRTS